MAKKPQSKVGAERATLTKLTNINPIRGLTPARLIQVLDAFNRGEIRQAALLWQQIIDRDDQVGPCADKRTRAVASLQWEVLQVDDSAEAQRQKAELEHFYNNLSAYDGLNEMERGGMRQLIKQMMTATALRYAMHEIIWRPGAPGGLTADFKFLPLQFFENTTGRLRFLKHDHDLYGVDLDDFFGEGGWMCNAGRGLMVASSIAYLFKVPAGLKAWVSFMEKFGTPPVHATTSAVKDSAEWDQVVDAVEGYGEDLALVTDEGTKVNVLAMPNGGQAPHAPLVDRMDRAISRIWMGGDLATMSAVGPSGTGSNPQSDDLDKIQADDAAGITDYLQYYVDRQVIRMLHGDGAKLLAYVRLVVPKKKTTDESAKKIETASKHGVELSKAYVRQELNLPEPKPSDELITAPAPATPPFQAPFARAANERPARPTGSWQGDPLRAAALKDLSEAQAKALRPLVDRIKAILALPDDKIDGAMEALQRDLPRINREVLRDEQTRFVFERILGTALIQGAATAAEKQDLP
jgi:phage gp29-like protein